MSSEWEGVRGRADNFGQQVKTLRQSGMSKALQDAAFRLMLLHKVAYEMTRDGFSQAATRGVVQAANALEAELQIEIAAQSGAGAPK